MAARSLCDLFCEGRIALATPDVVTIRDHFVDGFVAGTQEENSFLAAKFHAPAWHQIVRANWLAND